MLERLYLKNWTTNFAQTFSVPCPRPYEGLWTFFMQYYPQTKIFWQKNYFFISKCPDLCPMSGFVSHVRISVPCPDVCPNCHFSFTINNWPAKQVFYASCHNVFYLFWNFAPLYPFLLRSKGKVHEFQSNKPEAYLKLGGIASFSPVTTNGSQGVFFERLWLIQEMIVLLMSIIIEVNTKKCEKNKKSFKTLFFNSWTCVYVPNH